jgi:2-polyprenyl-3-methyl-5-hydroxy-6-metoxy-1,4-benzoquinol methylase
MAISAQQQEALTYFRRFAHQWRQKAEGSVPNRVNVIKQRNDYVLEVARTRDHVSSFLDVGCGSGELVCEIARLGTSAVGVDFASEMIELCRRKAEAEAISGVEFVHSSIFDYRPTGISFDLISANGFIEYISEEELVDLIAHARSLLAPGGTIVVGSRNRIFNAFSLNEYTQQEVETGALEQLIAEAMILVGAGTVDGCVKRLVGIDESLPSLTHHPMTGVAVSTRHLYTPGQLIRLFRNAGFESVDLYPIHYHGLIPLVGREHPDVHVAISNLVQEYARSERHHLIPLSSSFMLQVELV